MESKGPIGELSVVIHVFAWAAQRTDAECPCPGILLPAKGTGA